MITLEEYKEMIVNTFSDDILTTKEVRRERLERDYPDKLLNKVIEDTYQVAKEIRNDKGRLSWIIKKKPL